jgi:hypothetical protein
LPVAGALGVVFTLSTVRAAKQPFLAGFFDASFFPYFFVHGLLLPAMAVAGAIDGDPMQTTWFTCRLRLAMACTCIWSTMM